MLEGASWRLNSLLDWHILEATASKTNGHFAYYWLRMAAENSSEVQQRSARLVEKLKTKITRAGQEFHGSTRHRQHGRPAVRDVDHCIFISLHGITGEQGHGSRPPTPLMRTFPLTNNM